jgi:hypothetical protein
MVASPSAAPGPTIPISQVPRLNWQPEGVTPLGGPTTRLAPAGAQGEQRSGPLRQRRVKF